MQSNNEKPKSWKLLSMLLPASMATGTIIGAAPDASANQGFINAVAPMAQAGQQQYGVPASVSIAQAILESGWGQSGLTRSGNAYFGIKCTAQRSPHQAGCTSMPTREVINGRSIMIVDGFRTYATGADSFRDHGHFLRVNSRYAPAFQTKSADDFARAIARAGYATDPNYANALIRLMNQYDLRRFDASAAPAKPKLNEKFKDLAGKYSGMLGSVRANSTNANGSTWQEFDNGLLVETPNGQFVIRNGIYTSYRNAVNQGVKLGLPLGNEGSVTGGWKQSFQYGDIFYTTDGKSLNVRNGMATRYRDTNKPTLGVPLNNEHAEGNAIVQDFTGGRIFWTSQRGGIAVVGKTYEQFKANGGVGRYGLPTAEQKENAEGAGAQTFERGAITWSAENGYQPIVGGIYTTFNAAGGFDKLGAAKSAETSIEGGWVQTFDNGQVFFSNKPKQGGAAVTGGIASAVESIGADKVGMPLSAEKAVPGGWSQEFENGTVLTGKYGSFLVSGDIAKKFKELGGVEKLGVPTSEETTIGDTVVQKFRHGEIRISNVETIVVRGAIFAGYDSAGGAEATGAPLRNEYEWNDGWRQDFENGSVLGGGRADFNFVPSQIMKRYEQRAKELGKPIAPAEITETQISQVFQNGSITVTIS